MKNKLKQHTDSIANKRTTIRTSILEIIRVLNELTPDDNLVIAAARHLLTSCRVTAARSLRPVKITATQRADLHRKLPHRNVRGAAPAELTSKPPGLFTLRGNTTDILSGSF